MTDNRDPDASPTAGARRAARGVGPADPGTARGGLPAQARATDPAAADDDSEHSGSTAPGRRALRALSHVVLVLVPLIVLPALALGLGYVRLKHGAVSLPFLKDPIQRGIAAEMPGITANIDDIVLAMENGKLEFRLKNLRLKEADGDTVVYSPTSLVEISGLALKAFRIVPSRVELIGPKLAVTLAEDGRLALAVTATDRIAGEAAADGEAASGAIPHARPDRPAAATEVLPAEMRDAERHPPADAVSTAGEAPRRAFDIAKMLADATARARRRVDAVSYLREIGVRNATVEVAVGKRRSQWTIPQLSVDLEHKSSRSIVSGAATVASPRGPWSLTFRTEDLEGASARRAIAVRSSLRGLVPAALAHAAPDLPLLPLIEVPISGDLTIDLTQEGDVRGAALAIELGRGQLHSPAQGEVPVDLDAGLLKLKYDGATRRVELEPSTIVSGSSRVTLVGEMTREQAADGNSAWPFAVRASEGVLGAEEFGIKPVPIETLAVEGRLLPGDGLVRIDSGVLKAAGAEVSAAGDIAFGRATAARIEGQLKPMTAAALKTVWPKALAPGARAWVGRHLINASIKGGTLRWITGLGDGQAGMAAPAMARGMGATASGPPVEGNRLSFAIEASDVRIAPIENGPPIDAPRVLTRLEGQALEVAIPEATVVLPQNRKVPLKGVRFAIADVRPDIPWGEVNLRVLSPLGPVIELADQPPFEALHQAGIKLEGVDGKFDAQVKVAWPLAPAPDASDVKIEGKGRITDGRARQLVGAWDAHGASIAFDITDKAVDASGDMLVAGVPLKLGWQRLFGVAPDKQPPLRLTANVDSADRNQLGLDLNHMVQGDVPVEVTVTRGAQNEPQVRLRADLTASELMLDAIAWKKPSGRQAILQCDIVKGKQHKLELQNFKLAGEDIAIEGWAAAGADNRLREFHFKDFSLNVVSRLEVQGTLRADNVWDVKARGATYDGRDFFRTLFHMDQLAEKQVKPLKPRAGIDLTADIDTVLGFSEVSLRGLKVKLSRRGDKLTLLDARGGLDSGKQVAVEMRPPSGNISRMILADSNDAGQAFRLVGFYPNVQGGRVRLEVNLDGRGAAEKTGILWLDNFRVLGDPVLSEVVGSADTSRPAIEGGKRGKPQMVRETFDFDRMKVPFSLGHGQFAMEESYLKGPLLGASLRGNIDYNTKVVNIGGTYIPLQGLNNALGDIPLIGQILSGPRGEGIFGITFAVQGAMAQPQVIVNPLSVVAPGIFREIFQLSNPDTKVRAVPAAKAAPPPEARVRASSTPAGAPSAGAGEPAPGKQKPAAASAGAVPLPAAKVPVPAKAAPKPKPAAKDDVDGWSSQVAPQPTPKTQ